MDASSPRAVRLEAVRVLVSYFDPMITVGYRSNATEDAPASSYVIFGEWSHPVGHEGREPLPSTIQGDIRAILSQLRASGGDAVVAKTSGYLLKRLESK
jgi:hypothetical protein